MKSPLKLGLLATAGFFLANGLVLMALPEERSAIRSAIEEALPQGRERGFACKAYRDVDGRLYKYAVFVPHGMTAEDRLPLILYLNGFGKNGDDGLGPLRDGLGPTIWEMQRTFPFVAVFPQCPQEESWAGTGPTAEPAVKIMRKTAEEYHTDPDRVYLTGLSSGGSGVWTIAAANPGMFAAIAPCSPGKISDSAVESIAKSHLPVWNFYVDGDPRCDKVNRENFQRLLKAGASPRFTELDGKKEQRWNLHNSWDAAFRNAGLFAWLWEQRRSANAAAQKSFSPLTIAPDLAGWRAVGGGDWTVDADGTVSCSHKGTGNRAWLITETPLRNFELHLEFQSDSQAGCGVGFGGLANGQPASGFSVEIVPSNSGSGGVFDIGRNRWMQSAEPSAQRTLVNGWNDLRIRVSGDRMIVELNGWPLNDVQDVRIDERIAGPNNRFIGLHVNGNRETAVRWRNLRIRDIDASEATSDPEPSAIMIDPAPSKPITIEAVIEGWRRREQHVASAQVTWDVDRTGISRASRFRSAVVPTKPLPDADRSTLRLKDERIRYETTWWYREMPFGRSKGISAPESHAEYQRLLESCFRNQTGEPLRFLGFRNGEDSTNCVTTISENAGRAVVTDRSQEKLIAGRDLDELFPLPVLLAYRPLSACGFGIDPARCRVDTQHSFVNEADCVRVREVISEGAPSIVRSYWVDPARDFVVLRYLCEKDAIPKEQLDIEYREDPAHGWSPSQWTAVAVPETEQFGKLFPGQESLFNHAQASVVDLSINEELPPESVAVVLPVGTKVHDRIQNVWQVEERGGSRRRLTQDEVMQITLAGNDNLLSGSTGWPLWQVVLVGVLIVAVCVAYMARVRSRGFRQNCDAPTVS